MSDKQYTMTVTGAAKALGLGRTTLYALINSGGLRRIKVGRRTLITIDSVENFIAQASIGEAN